MDNELQACDKQLYVAADFSKFEDFLIQLKLPTENIIASPEERIRIMNAFPEFISSLPDEVKKEARYLSKFIAGSAVGLFDASLNFLWNEVVITIRKKIIAYGLDLFFDEAVGSRLRDEYNTENDLAGIKDRVLLDTCLKLELISEIVYKKLVHILDMRNDIGSSHPNQYSINSYELLGWLQTCINEVLKEEASKSAITVQQIIGNIKKSTVPLESSMIGQFSENLKDVSKNLVDNLLSALFGLYVSNQTDSIVRQNISKVAPIVWNQALDSKKYDLGIKIDTYRINFDTERVKNAESFFEICDGKRYFSNSERISKLDVLCDELKRVHYEWDNFYYEVPFAREIMTYIKKSEDIPQERSEKIIETFLLCRIGREVAYCNGISPNGKKYYDDFFKILNKEQVVLVLQIMNKPIIRCMLDGKIIGNNMKSILTILKNGTLGDRVNEIIDFILQQQDLSMLIYNKKYQELAKGIIL